jgi:hypothetical protein
VEHRKIPVSAEVVAVLRAHFYGRTQVYSTFSDPDGSHPLGTGRPTMFTEWGIEDSPIPLFGAETTWDRGADRHARMNAKTDHWICIPILGEE